MGFDLSTGDDVRSVSLRSGLRGYDKGDVDDFRASVADLVDDLRHRLDAASGHLAQLGLDDPLDLKHEFASVGKEVTAILEAARTAATDMRQRAAADAEQWREEAAADAARMRTEAWDEASSRLERAVSEAAQTRAAADEDALFIRAQAEKEAIRLTSEAKRDGEEVVRSARVEAEAIVAEAREAAEAAQQRTRALEVRREELMAELEQARRAIGIVEAEIEEQHQRLRSPETATVRIIDQSESSDDVPDSSWLDEDATVRLVPAEPRRREVELEPVIDADDIVAEVERLQIEPEVDDPWSSTDTEPVPPLTEPPALVAEDDTSTTATSTTTEQEPTGPAGAATVTEPPDHDELVNEAASEALAPDMEEMELEAEADVLDPGEGTTDGLADLFASLRTPSVAPSMPTEEPVPVEADRADAVVPDEAPNDSVSMPDGPADLTVPDEEPPPGSDAFAERESALLPLTNRALRAVKKQILEFQNVMLEATKADPDGWRPDAEEYRLALDPHLQALADEAHRAAGGEGASALSVEFGAALAAAVSRAAETMSGSGYRETSASLGRIYRSWRSDEAERRLTALAAEAFDAAEAAPDPT